MDILQNPGFSDICFIYHVIWISMCALCYTSQQYPFLIFHAGLNFCLGEFPQITKNALFWKLVNGWHFGSLQNFIQKSHWSGINSANSLKAFPDLSICGTNNKKKHNRIPHILSWLLETGQRKFAFLSTYSYPHTVNLTCRDHSINSPDK